MGLFGSGDASGGRVDVRWECGGGIEKLNFWRADGHAVLDW